MYLQKEKKPHETRYNKNVCVCASMCERVQKSRLKTMKMNMPQSGTLYPRANYILRPELKSCEREAWKRNAFL